MKWKEQGPRRCPLGWEVRVRAIDTERGTSVIAMVKK